MTGVIEITLTHDERRKLVETEKGEHCFRMWLTRQEWERSEKDYTAHELKDGRIAIWRPISALHKLRESGDLKLIAYVEGRILDDSVE